MTSQDILKKHVLPLPYPGSLQGGITFREHAAIELLKGRLASGNGLNAEDVVHIVYLVGILAAALAKETQP